MGLFSIIRRRVEMRGPIEDPSVAHGKKVVEIGLNVAKCCGTCRQFDANDMTQMIYGEGWGVCPKHSYDNGNGPVSMVTHECLFCNEANWECDEDNTAVANYICAAHTAAREGVK
jgi:hypothetical protein